MPFLEITSPSLAGDGIAGHFALVKYKLLLVA